MYNPPPPLKKNGCQGVDLINGFNWMNLYSCSFKWFYFHLQKVHKTILETIKLHFLPHLTWPFSHIYIYFKDIISEKVEHQPNTFLQWVHIEDNS